MIFAFTVPLGVGTNNQVEIQAAIYGLQWCINHGYHQVLLEVDSKLLIQWITTNSEVPWSLFQFVNDLKEVVSQFSCLQCHHTCREANDTADMMSKWSHRFDIIQHYYTYQQLPSRSKSAYLLDRLGMINFRRRKPKRIKQPP